MCIDHSYSKRLRGKQTNSTSTDGQKDIDAQSSEAGQTIEGTSNLNEETPVTESSKTPPIVDHLDVYPFPIPLGWNEEIFEVREYDEGMDWEAVFTFEGDEQEQAAAYKKIIEELGYETQVLLSDVFKIGMAEFAGIPYHGTFTFGIGDEYSSWGEGQRYVEISFSEKR